MRMLAMLACLGLAAGGCVSAIETGVPFDAALRQGIHASQTTGPDVVRLLGEPTYRSRDLWIYSHLRQPIIDWGLIALPPWSFEGESHELAVFLADDRVVDCLYRHTRFAASEEPLVILSVSRDGCRSAR